MATLLVCHCLLKLQIELKGMNVCLPTLEKTLKCVQPKPHLRFSGERDLGRERVLVPHQILVKWSETNSLGVKLWPYLSYGSLAKWEQESLTLGTKPACWLVVSDGFRHNNIHLKWPKQFVFLGQYMFLHFFQQVKDYFLPCDYLKNINLTCILLGVMWSGNCVWK